MGLSATWLFIDQILPSVSNYTAYVHIFFSNFQVDSLAYAYIKYFDEKSAKDAAKHEVGDFRVLTSCLF